MPFEAGRPALLKRELSPADLYKIRAALSDIFVDTGVDYPYIARQIENYDPEQVKDILYAEVAVVCAGNLECVLPPVWTGFEPDALNRDIEQMLLASNNSWIRRQLHKMHTAWLRYSYREVWDDITAHCEGWR
ncbi:hypothetical protein [Pseudomonas sp. PB103]|jgi:hypothetical protein|uniref:DUF7079 family protein n=1 Tax=Pseudomonas sp. PB103 TaxID=2494698 RepID=UPI002115B377|nr:hypothetical protein [Pseudomonas sp. PB103]